MTGRPDLALPTVEAVATMTDAELRALQLQLAGDAQHLAAVLAAIAARLAAGNHAQGAQDRLLTLHAAAVILTVAPDWLRRQKTLPFRIEVSPGQVRYSAQGIARFIARRAGK